jgi:hypothetical protein
LIIEYGVNPCSELKDRIISLPGWAPLAGTGPHLSRMAGSFSTRIL